MLPMIGGIWFYRRTPAGIRVSVPFRLRPAISRDENPSVTEIHHKFVSRTKSGGSAYSDHLPRAQHFSFDISVGSIALPLARRLRWLYPRGSPMNELWRLSASEVARLASTSKASARDVADAALERVDRGSTRSSTADCIWCESRQTGW